MEPYPRIIPVGDTAVSVEFGDTIEPALLDRVRGLEAALLARNVAGLRETVPSFRSLLVFYEPAEIGWQELLAAIRGAARACRPPAAEPGRAWTVPVAYGPPLGEDLPDVARRCGMTAEEVVAAHSAPDYLVFLVGFAPGIPIMGGLPPALHLPRRTAPRPRVPARSVVIAGGQLSILSVEAPSGWHVLGRTPVWPFRPGRDAPFLFRAGDVIRFRPTGAAQYAAMAEAAAAGEDVISPEPLPAEPSRPASPAACGAP